MLRALGGVFLFSICACSSVDERGSVSEQAFVNGTPTEEFPAVGRLWYGSDAAGWSSCTATLIRPQVVLTAAHCVTGKDGLEIKARFKGKNYSGDAWMLSATYEPHAPLDRSFDWAIIHLSEPVTDVEWMRMTTDVPEPATWFTAVGFGKDAFDGQSGTKRKVGAWISRTNDHYVDAKARSSTHEGAGPATACFGDSGSPAIDSEGRVFGVLSRVPHECQADGKFSYTRVSVEWNTMHDQISAWNQ